MSRRYGPIGTSVWDSERFLSLPDDSTRLSYIYLIACPHGNSVGVFRLPASYFSADRKVDLERGEAMLGAMEAARLIERDHEQIRILRWFFNDTGANNPSTASAFCKVFSDTRLVKRGDLRTRALVEMLIATLTKAEAWNPTSGPFGQMVKDLQNFAVAEIKRDAEHFIQALREHDPPEPSTVLNTVFDTVSYTVGIQGVEHLWDIRTRDTDTETGDRRLRQDTGYRRQDTGGAGGGGSASAPPASPAGGSRSGRNLPGDVAAVIGKLNAAAPGKAK